MVNKRDIIKLQDIQPSIILVNVTSYNKVTKLTQKKLELIWIGNSITELNKVNWSSGKPASTINPKKFCHYNVPEPGPTNKQLARVYLNYRLRFLIGQLPNKIKFK